MDNREKILNVSLRLFASKGYDAVGIQEIVNESEVTKPTLYHYFESKRGLLDQLLEKYFKELCDLTAAAATYNGDLTLNLTRIAETFFAFAKANREFYRMQLSMCFSSPESEPFSAVAKYNETIYSVIERMFEDAVRDHGNMKGRHKRYAFTFIGILNNYITLYLMNYSSLDSNEVYLAVHQFSHGIYS